ncbi:hypothetical protein AYO38_06740 [bacterium SCGC AG-212-C10]|nr:hypothetical protein AYO38_06740 [bacterium SCGC AG-212-C10]
MYSPAHNRESDPAALRAFMREYNFATLVTAGEGGPMATHLPVLIDGEGSELTITGHIARANHQWRDFASGREALIIFQGPHAYISPSLYENRVSVPTWNYAAVHAYGEPQILGSREEREAIVRGLVEQHDPAYLPQYESLPSDWVDGRLSAIVAFSLRVVRIEARFKYSQDRTVHDREAIVAALSGSDDSAARAVADAMRRPPATEHGG